MKLLDLMAALTQEEVIDEMLVSYAEEEKKIHVTFFDSVYRGLTITGEDDEFNVEM